MRYAITDELWAAMEPLVRRAKTHRGGQPPAVPDRAFFEALLYLGRTGVPLRDLPGEFGAWDAVYNRLRRWVQSGAMGRLFAASSGCSASSRSSAGWLTRYDVRKRMFLGWLHLILGFIRRRAITNVNTA